MMSLQKNGTKQKQMRALEQLMEKRLFKPRLPGYNSTNSALYCYTLVQKVCVPYLHNTLAWFRRKECQNRSNPGLGFLNHNDFLLNDFHYLWMVPVRFEPAPHVCIITVAIIQVAKPNYKLFTIFIIPNYCHNISHYLPYPKIKKCGWQRHPY